MGTLVGKPLIPALSDDLPAINKLQIANLETALSDARFSRKTFAREAWQSSFTQAGLSSTQA